MGKALKSVAKIALPVIGTAVGGPVGGAIGGAIGGAVGGGGLKGAALGAIGGGLGGGIFGGTPAATGFGLFDSLNSSIYSGLSPLRTIGSSLFGGSSNGGSPLSQLFGGGSSGSTSSSAMPWLDGVAKGVMAPNTSTGALPWLKEVAAGTAKANPFAIAENVANRGVLQGISDAISSPSLKDITSVAQLAQSLFGKDPAGMLSQQDILNQMNADKAKQDQQTASFIASLNSSPLQRVQTNPSVDYYTYGTRPEVKFFDKIEGDPQKFAKGGKVYADDSIKGQADTVHAKLSEGEYVIPADVVASLGDGNSLAGAKALDQMLKQVRKTKAPAMKKGVLPPKSKSPLAYIGKAA